MAKSRAEKTLQARQRRKKERKMKRINNPLRIYIERKHSKIFKEFMDFLNAIERDNPRKKDLTKTEAFKKWIEKNPIPNTSLNSSETANSTMLSPHIQVSLLNLNEIPPSSTTNHETSPSTNHETETSPSSTTNHETSPSTNHETETETSPSSTTNHETISDIIDELFESNVIPDTDILPDEGINLLDLLEDVAFDYQDFNFITDTDGF